MAFLSPSPYGGFFMCYNFDMKLVVGLGNPEAKYNFTRHNLGFLCLDFYFTVHQLKWSEKARLSALSGRKGDILFIKPQEYYNNSGQAVREYMRYYKIPLEDLLVVCDDFNLPFGEIRFRSAGSAGGNNGLKSIIKELGTEDFARIRIGTGNEELRKRVGDIDFVLSKFTPEERVKLPAVLREANLKIDERLD